MKITLKLYFYSPLLKHCLLPNTKPKHPPYSTTQNVTDRGEAFLQNKCCTIYSEL